MIIRLRRRTFLRSRMNFAGSFRSWPRARADVRSQVLGRPCPAGVKFARPGASQKKGAISEFPTKGYPPNLRAVEWPVRHRACNMYAQIFGQNEPLARANKASDGPNRSPAWLRGLPRHSPRHFDFPAGRVAGRWLLGGTAAPAVPPARDWDFFISNCVPAPFGPGLPPPSNYLRGGSPCRYAFAIYISDSSVTTSGSR
jgi:hypothetical protein